MGECLIVRGGNNVNTSNATASSDVIANGYSCYVNDELIIGTIPIIDSKKTLSPDETILLKEGYYNDNQFEVSSFVDATLSTATNQTVHAGYDGWANGAHVIGSIEPITDEISVLEPNGVYIVPMGWHSGNGKLIQSMPTIAATSITPTTENQTLCDVGKWTIGELVVAGDVNLINANIKNGVNIFGITGTFLDWVDATAPIKSVATVSGGSTSVYATSRTSTSSATCMTVTPNSNISKFKNMTVSASVSGSPNGSDWEWCWAAVTLNGVEVCYGEPPGNRKSFSSSGSKVFGIITSTFTTVLIGRAGRLNGSCSIVVNK